MSFVRDDEEQLIQAQDLAHIGSWQWEIVDDRVVWSRETCQIFGFDPLEAPYLNLQAYLQRTHPDDLERTRETIERCLQDHDPFTLLHRIVRPDGAIRVILCHGKVVLDASGRPARMYGTTQDVTERCEIEERLRKSVSLLRGTVESTADGILVVNRQGKIEIFNSKFREMWRIPASVVERMNDAAALEFVLDQLQDPDAFVRKVRELYDSPSAKSFDVLQFKDGRVFERYSQPQVLDDEIVGRVWSFRDVTERRRAEETLRLEKANLEKTNTELDNFTHIVSHDLRSPLRGIQEFLKFLERDRTSQISALGLEFVREIRRCARTMDRLIQDILKLARLNNIRNPYGEVLARDLIEQSLDLLRGDIQRLGIEIVVREPMPSLVCDAIKVKEVFFNLISNAVKFSSKNNRQHPRVAVGYSDRGGHHEFFVKDNGIGIEAQYYQQIFDMFRRLHTETEYEGTGAGLYIAKRIVDQHQGRIWVNSKPGRGATFYFTLPKSLPGAGPPQGSPAVC